MNHFQPLFTLLHREHKITPLESEMTEIIACVNAMQSYDTCIATIRRNQHPQEFAGWHPVHDTPRWTTDRLSAADIPLPELPTQLAKLYAHNPNVWAIITPK